MDLLNRIATTRFLGREFLTWLWFRSDRDEGLFKRSNGDQIEVWFDAKLVLEAGGDLKEQNVIKAENPTEAHEARVSLQTGKHAREARLRVVAEQKQWSVTVKGDELALGGMKIPSLLSREDDDQLYERLYLMEELEDILDELWRAFIRLRTDDDGWRAELEQIREWVHAG